MDNQHSRQRQPHNRCSDLLPYTLILEASKGDHDAIATVLRHYEGYITRMSMRKLYDGQGNSYLCVDETMRRRLEIKLIAGILAFHIA